jgi:putative ABC transport system ATP-binding protein
MTRHSPLAMLSNLKYDLQSPAMVHRSRRHPATPIANEPTGKLDSKNGDAVMDLLHNLHRSGATILMVTHDARFARHAGRTAHLFDGRIVDERVEKRDQRI